MVTEIELAECPELTVLGFCLWGWMKSEVNKIKVDTADELLAGILDGAGCGKRREDQLRRTARDLRTRVAKGVEVDGGIFERLLRTVRNLLFVCNKFLFKTH